MRHPDADVSRRTFIPESASTREEYQLLTDRCLGTDLATGFSGQTLQLGSRCVGRSKLVDQVRLKCAKTEECH